MVIDLVLITFGIVLLLLMIYMYMKEQDSNLKFKILATRVDTINRQFYRMDKDLKSQLDKNREDLINDYNSLITGGFDVNNKNEEMETLKRNFEHLLYEVDNLKNNIQSRLYALENGFKSAVLDRNSSGIDKTQQIINYYQQGYSIEDITRELRISRTEVEFALKMSRFQ
jgi:chaperonin cofactor prefoldin